VLNISQATTDYTVTKEINYYVLVIIDNSLLYNYYIIIISKLSFYILLLGRIAVLHA